MVIRTLMVLGGAAVAALSSAAAVAGTVPAASHEPYASHAITAGDYSSAERILQPASYADAADPARLINMATVYARTQRVAEARQALLRVQALPDEALELDNGASYSSHKLAGVMLGRIGGN